MKIVEFQPKDDGKPIVESTDVIEGEDEDDIDMHVAANRAHAIYGALSTIDLTSISPKEFWASDPVG